MKRRQFVGYAGAGLLGALVTSLGSQFPATAQSGGSLTVKWLGHTSFLFTGGGKRILSNPFQNIGCTAGYRSPKVETDLVLISSQLLDEGAVDGLPGSPKLIYEPGVYEYEGIQFQGIATPHDRVGGRRFGINVAWKWQQGGIDILHLGGMAAPITIEQKILMGRPDLLLIPVGGGPKAYNPEEAKQAIATLNPRLVIPTHYRTQAAEASCDIVPLDEFMGIMQGMPVRRSNNDTITLRPGDLPKDGTAIQVLSYKF